jgi:hypothetical protein
MQREESTFEDFSYPDDVAPLIAPRERPSWRWLAPSPGGWKERLQAVFQTRPT